MNAGKPSFGQRLAHAIAAKGPLCAGIDPHSHLLQAWGQDDNVAGLAAFTEAAYTGLKQAAILKPQMAFYERFGSAGIRVLEDLLAQARADGVLTVVDVKRGDIGSTMDGYASAYLEPGAPLECDAITVSPYLGPAVFQASAERTLAHGKGLFLLVLTSNSQARWLQRAVSVRGSEEPPDSAVLGRLGSAHAGAALTVAGGVLEWINALNAGEDVAAGALASVGSVIGATITDADGVLGPALAANTGPILAPGFGAQGATAAQIAERFAHSRGRVLVNASRSLLSKGPQISAMAEEVSRLQEELCAVLN